MSSTDWASSLQYLVQKNVKDVLSRQEEDCGCQLLFLSNKLEKLLPISTWNDSFNLHHLNEELDALDDNSRFTYVHLPNSTDVKEVALHFDRWRAHKGMHVTMICIGQWLARSQEILMELNVYNYATLETIPPTFLALDNDLLTLEREKCLTACYIDDDLSDVHDIADALVLFEQAYAPFKRIKAKGELAMEVLQEFVTRKSEEMPTLSSPPSHSGEIQDSSCDEAPETLILLDRSIDFASAVSIPLTYAALLCELGLDTEGVSGKKDDPLYQQLRSQHIHAIPTILQTQAKELKKSFAEFNRSSADAETSEIHSFVQSMPQLKQRQKHVEHHTDMMERLHESKKWSDLRDEWWLDRAIIAGEVNVIQEVQRRVSTGQSFVSILRVMCLYNAVNDGFRPEEFFRLKQILASNYGADQYTILNRFERMGMLSVNALKRKMYQVGEPLSTFRQVALKLGCIDLEVNVHDPENPAFVSSGYAPISCMLVKAIVKSGSWKPFDDVVRRIPGPRTELSLENSHSGPFSFQRPKAMVVCFIGGISYMELAALRWIGRQYDCRIIVATTHVTSVMSFLKSIEASKLPETEFAPSANLPLHDDSITSESDYR